ncbi:DNA-binding MarR family transcriptional regulator [Bradyrhizobium elkanii]
MGAIAESTMPRDLPSPATAVDNSSAEGQRAARRFVWEIRSINAHLEELRQLRADGLGITGPQWMILMALVELDREKGIPVHVVSKLMYVDPSFVTTQSKLLEKKGFLRRRPCTIDARVVQMSLTKKTYKHLANLKTQQNAIDECVFGDFRPHELTEFVNKLAALTHRLKKARLKAALG